MALTCDPQTLSLAAGAANALSQHELLAAEAYYLYRQANTGTGTTAVSAATLLNNAKCLACDNAKINDSHFLKALEVYILRQRAIDAGWAGESTGSLTQAGVRALRSQINGLTNLSNSQLEAIIICLRAGLA